MELVEKAGANILNNLKIFTLKQSLYHTISYLARCNERFRAQRDLLLLVTFHNINRVYQRTVNPACNIVVKTSTFLSSSGLLKFWGAGVIGSVKSFLKQT